MYAKQKTCPAPMMKTSNNVLENHHLGGREGPLQRSQVGLVQLLEGCLHLLQQRGIGPLLHCGQVSQPVVLPEFEGLFVAFILKFDADPLARFKYGDLQGGVLDVADDAHGWLTIVEYLR